MAVYLIEYIDSYLDSWLFSSLFVERHKRASSAEVSSFLISIPDIRQAQSSTWLSLHTYRVMRCEESKSKRAPDFLTPRKIATFKFQSQEVRSCESPTLLYWLFSTDCSQSPPRSSISTQYKPLTLPLLHQLLQQNFHQPSLKPNHRPLHTNTFKNLNMQSLNTVQLLLNFILLVFSANVRTHLG